MKLFIIENFTNVINNLIALHYISYLLHCIFDYIVLHYIISYQSHHKFSLNQSYQFQI
jgi:hypothetical protein